MVDGQRIESAKLKRRDRAGGTKDLSGMPDRNSGLLLSVPGPEDLKGAVGIGLTTFPGEARDFVERDVKMQHEELGE